MSFNTSETDRLLSTTRSVKTRLDLTREVSDELILDCIDIAEQAPTGGNQSSRRWLVVRDSETKKEIAELYREVGGEFLKEQAELLDGTGHHNEKTIKIHVSVDIKKLENLLQDIPDCKIEQDDRVIITIHSTNSEIVLMNILKILNQNNIVIEDLSAMPTNLEEIFLKVVSDSDASNN